MVDRIRSDHPHIQTYRATVARHGGRRHRLDLPPAIADDLTAGSIVRATVTERERFACLERVSGGLAIVRLTTTHAGAEAAGSDCLSDYLQRWDISRGQTVLVDIIVPNEHIGLRPPGTTAVYPAPQQRNASLTDIAQSIFSEE